MERQLCIGGEGEVAMLVAIMEGRSALNFDRLP